MNNDGVPPSVFASRLSVAKGGDFDRPAMRIDVGPPQVSKYCLAGSIPSVEQHQQKLSAGASARHANQRLREDAVLDDSILQIKTLRAA